jgi:hypothetical protein
VVDIFVSSRIKNTTFESKKSKLNEVK